MSVKRAQGSTGGWLLPDPAVKPPGRPGPDPSLLAGPAAGGRGPAGPRGCCGCCLAAAACCCCLSCCWRAASCSARCLAAASCCRAFCAACWAACSSARAAGVMAAASPRAASRCSFLRRLASASAAGSACAWWQAVQQSELRVTAGSKVLDPLHIDPNYVCLIGNHPHSVDGHLVLSC